MLFLNAMMDNIICEPETLVIRWRFQPQLISSCLKVVAKGDVINKLTFGRARVTRIKCNTWKVNLCFWFWNIILPLRHDTRKIFRTWNLKQKQSYWFMKATEREGPVGFVHLQIEGYKLILNSQRELHTYKNIWAASNMTCSMNGHCFLPSMMESNKTVMFLYL